MSPASYERVLQPAVGRHLFEHLMDVMRAMMGIHRIGIVRLLLRREPGRERNRVWVMWSDERSGESTE